MTMASSFREVPLFGGGSEPGEATMIRIVSPRGAIYTGGRRPTQDRMAGYRAEGREGPVERAEHRGAEPGALRSSARQDLSYFFVNVRYSTLALFLKSSK